MSSQSWLVASDLPATAAKTAAIQRRSDEIAAEALARDEKRKLAFEELKSALYLPRERISAWEKLHGLQLPFDSKHPILASIALSTGLTLAQVREEQGARNEERGARVHSPGANG